MRQVLMEGDYNTSIEPSDWRYSAAIVGLIKYFEYHGINYRICDDERLEFNSDEISQDKYLEFVEWYYPDEFYHKKVEQILSSEECSEDMIKLVNEMLVGNTVMKKTFPKIKFDGTNKDHIITILNQSRERLVCETFRNKKNLYANYCNTNQLFEEGKLFCRLNGYYIDAGKKGKSAAYYNDTNTYSGKDDIVFDFIPFAFTGSRESFFINENLKIEDLCESNQRLANKAVEDLKEDNKEVASSYSDIRKVLFKTIIETNDFLRFDTEVIYKNRDRDYFETLYIRKESIAILKTLKGKYKAFCIPFKINENYYINVQEEVVDCILNLKFTDFLIELMLKAKGDYQYLIDRLIEVNLLVRGGTSDMNKGRRDAQECAKKVVNKLATNKLKSYRQKLISAVVFKDYDRACQILLQLSNYVDVQFSFANDLFEDFEAHKELAYTFINTLNSQKQGGKENE